MFNVVKGTHDVIKEEALKYSYIEETLTNIAVNYGYQEFRTPIIEIVNYSQEALVIVAILSEKKCTLLKIKVEEV